MFTRVFIIMHTTIIIIKKRFYSQSDFFSLCFCGFTFFAFLCFGLKCLLGMFFFFTYVSISILLCMSYHVNFSLSHHHIRIKLQLPQLSLLQLTTSSTHSFLCSLSKSAILSGAVMLNSTICHILFIWLFVYV